MLDAAPWYVVNVEPRTERKVKARTDGLGIEAFYPISKRLVPKRARRYRELVLCDYPAMPGYVFVRFGDLGFARFRREYDAPDAVAHCLGFLSSDKGPVRVGDDVVVDIRSRQDRGDFDLHVRCGRHLVPRWMRPGRFVRITGGPLCGKVGEVFRIRAGAAALWVPMLGVTTMVEVPFDWLGRAR